MSEPACQYGKCIIAPLYDQQIELTRHLRELVEAQQAGIISPENQAQTNNSIDEMQRDIERLKLEIAIGMSKVCDICPYHIQSPDSKDAA